MQSYTEIASTTKLNASLTPLLNNTKTVMSNSSGTAFPTANLQIGMACFRTDDNSLYLLKSTGPSVWTKVADADQTYVDKEYTDTQLGTKQATITGGATTIATTNLTVSRALASDASGKVVVSGTTSVELGYLSGVTSSVQTQLNGKAASGHSHSLATAGANGFMAAADKSKLDGIAAGAEVNQNAFTTIAVSGQSSVVADAKSDTLTFVAGSNITITTSAAGDSVTIASTGVGAASVGQAELKTSTGEISVSNASTVLTLPGGSYGFFPQVKGNDTGDSYWGAGLLVDIGTTKGSSHDSWWGAIGTSYVTRMTLAAPNFDTIYAQQRYVTASPPYNLGHGDIPVFIFALVDNATGDIVSTYVADTPPWIYNGPTQAWADRYDTDGKAYRKKQVGGALFDNRFKNEQSMQAYLTAVENAQGKYEEITHAHKNADMDLIPHPFTPQAGQTVVVIDPLSPVADKIQSLTSIGETASDILYKHINLGNSPVDAGFHPSVMAVGASWKMN